MSVPKLRFKEFDGDWLSAPLKKYFPKIRNGFVGVATPYYVEKGVKYLQGKNVKDGKIDPAGLIYISEEFHLKKNNSKLSIDDILMVQSGHVGECAVIEREYDNANCHALIVLSPHQQQKTNSHFVKYYFYTPLGKKIISQVKTGNTIEHVLASEIKEVELNFPSKEEQTKIASFLSAVDEKISQLTQKHELLSQYKQGMMQKLFSQQIRFKADDGSEFGEWEEIVLSDVATRITRKNKEDNQNALTISAQMGLVNQQEYFSKQIASRDLTKYYLLHKGEFAYNKSYSAGYPMGAIKRLKLYEKGVVSTLYICFSLNTEINSDFFEHYVESGALVPELEKIAQEGARNHGLLNISLQEFFEVALFKPCLEEQTKIANFLSSIDQKIEVVAEQIEQAKTWKKGLLQQMFV
ncbi:restriction endonuclease subunit S [Acinetobacter sp. CFCC 11171]|uniref:restriction endonuclease subunit S n=1 Tax=Acinetobacter sp. CFCC 11171 TaxID=1775558 RepID=UPI000DCFFC26|nr:restriction endonuclease subunit S [Acinetobacter sp. CFCC 11171]